MIGFSKENNRKSYNLFLIGLFLNVLSSCFTAAFFIIEEKLFRRYYLSPLKVVGYEGTFGVLITGIFLIIANFINCSHEICFGNKVEDSI